MGTYLEFILHLAPVELDFISQGVRKPMKKIFLLMVLPITSLKAGTWDLLGKWYLDSKNDQTQDLVWNTRLMQTESIWYRDNGLPVFISSISAKGLTHTGKYIRENKQGLDYADGMYFSFMGDSIRAYKDTESAGPLQIIRSYQTPLPLKSSGQLVIETDGKSFKKWHTWSGATDGNTAIKVSFASVTGKNTFDIKYFTHVFVYDLASSNLPDNDSTLTPVSSFRVNPEHSRHQYIQGAEVANGKVYIQLGGLHNAANDHKGVILEYSITGTYIQTHVFQAHKVINTAWQQDIYPNYLKVEYEGLMIKNDILYAQVFYFYGFFSPFTYKSLVYEVFDTKR